MTKSKPSVDPLLAGLKLAITSLPQLLPLVGPKGKALFAKVDEMIARRAIEEGLITEYEVISPGKGKKTTTTVYGVIKEAGARKVASAGEDGNLVPVLQSLLVAVQRFPTGTSTQSLPDPATIRSAVHEATPPIVSAIEQAAQKAVGEVAATVTKALTEFRQLLEGLPGKVELVVTKALPAGLTPGVKAALGELDQKVSRALPAPTSGPTTSTDPAPVLSALRIALDRLQVEPKVIKIPVNLGSHALSPPPIPKPDTVTSIADEILAFVLEWTQKNSVGPQFDAIMKHLRVRHTDVTIGCFHDALRLLANANPPRLRLSSWHKTIHELPEPDLALFIKHTINYHANTSQ